jgi:hypothetical protein
MIDAHGRRKASRSDSAEERNNVRDERLSSSEQIKAKSASKGGRQTVERDNQPGSVGWMGIES